MVSTRLLAMGRQAVAEVAVSVENGDPVVRCQLLASEFYEALRRELLQPCQLDGVTRRKLISARQCCDRVAIASISPPRMLEELRGAMRFLQAEGPPAPVLRVIQGGVSPV